MGDTEADSQERTQAQFDEYVVVEGSQESLSDGVDAGERLSKLSDTVSELRDDKQELTARVDALTAERDKYKRKTDRLRRENENLQSDPKFIATVKELTADGIIIKQHGNNQEALTQVTAEMREGLEAGDRVTINNTLSVIDRIEPEMAAEIKGMEVTASPDVTYDDIGGVDEEIQEVKEAIEMPIESPGAFDNLGIDPPSGVLLHGPPGTGKTMLAKAVAEQTDATFIRLAGSELTQKFVGEGARLVRELFEVAERKAPAVIFIDEIDAIASERGRSKTSGDEEVQRTMMQLLSELDGFEDREDISIIAATNRFDILDEAITRPGRFDRIINVDTPDADGAVEILELHTEDMELDSSVDLDEVAEYAGEVSGADIQAICTEAGMFALRDDRDVVTAADFTDACDKVLDLDEENVSSVSTHAFA